MPSISQGGIFCTKLGRLRKSMSLPRRLMIIASANRVTEDRLESAAQSEISSPPASNARKTGQKAQMPSEYQIVSSMICCCLRYQGRHNRRNLHR
jgi:hypothetical protein